MQCRVQFSENFFKLNQGQLTVHDQITDIQHLAGDFGSKLGEPLNDTMLACDCDFQLLSQHPSIFLALCTR